MLSTPLNNDVLLSILSVSPPKTATSIMATCSFLYHEGAKIVLQNPVELVGSEEKVLAILRFIQAEDLSRCPHVRILGIIMLSIPESITRILADLVPRMTGLKQLTLCGRLEQMFESYPYLLPTFAGLRSLKVLAMTYVGERCAEMIRTLQSELAFAYIHFPPTPPLDLSLAVAFNPIRMLARSASTLKQLSCGYMVDTNPGLTFSSPTAIYPQLRILIFHRHFPHNPIPFMRAFPNLTHLRVIHERRLEGVILESYRHNRELNLSMQRPLRAGETFGWRHLQEFTGHSTDLWVLGLTCRIPHMNLEDAPSARFPFILTDVLAFARPIRLTITFENRPLTDVLGGGFVPALQSEGASNLSSLAFTIDLTADDRNLNVGYALNVLGSALSVLKLRDLLFTVRDIGLSETATGASSAFPVSAQVRRSQSAPTSPARSCAPLADLAADQNASLSLGERTLNDIDVPLFVHHLMGVIPTIQNIVVGIERPGQCGSALRVGYSVKCKYGWAGPVYTGGNIAYREASGVHDDRAMWASVVKEWNTHLTSEETRT